MLRKREGEAPACGSDGWRNKKGCSKLSSFFLFLFFVFCLSSFFFCLDFLFSLFCLFMLCIVDTHAGKLVLDGHDWMLEQHAFLCAAHDFAEFTCLAGAKTRNFAAITDWLCDAVRTSVHLCHDGSQKCSTFWTELVIWRIMIAMAVNSEGFLDVSLFFWYIIFNFHWLFFR